MCELSLEEIKDIEMQIMKSLDEICKNNGWRYSLAGGTLLGAVRHGGFIPWDDDIDIIMPRPDYENLMQYCEKNKSVPFKIVNYKNTSGYNNLFAKIADNGTIVEDESIDMAEYRIGISIDVFPIDGLGDTFEKSKRLFNKTAIKRELLNAKTWKKFQLSKTHKKIYEPIRFVFFLISRFIDAKKLMISIDNVYSKNMFDKAQYAGSVCGCYRTKEIMQRTKYSEFEDMKFEDTYFKVIKSYDEYLKNLYGNYMEFPPENKRISHHTFKAYKL